MTFILISFHLQFTAEINSRRETIRFIDGALTSLKKMMSMKFKTVFPFNNVTEMCIIHMYMYDVSCTFYLADLLVYIYRVLLVKRLVVLIELSE